MLSAEARALAAKFGTDPGRAANDFHPLICHMLDVAAVTRAMWEKCLPDSVRRQVADGLGLDEAEAAHWVAFVAGLHDLGKASRPFQKKYDVHHAARLRGTNLDANTNREDPGHGVVTAAQLPPLLEQLGLDRRLARRLATVLGGHHGVFPLLHAHAGTGSGLDIGELGETRSRWERARSELLGHLAASVGVTGTPKGTLPNATAMLLAGLVSVADWIGSISDQGFFEFDPGGASDLVAYSQKAQMLAGKALAELKWRAYPEPGGPKSFTDLFPFPPRPLQSITERIRAVADVPGLVILEAPMGEGKTEAALHLVDQWNTAGARGVYIALPTQATANQMHDRVTKFLRDRHSAAIATGEDVNLVLAHGGTMLMDDLPVLPYAWG